MPDRQPAPGTTIRIAGRDRVLRFDYAGLCALESAVGMEEATDALSGLKPMLVRPRDLLYAGLKHADPMLTLEGAADLVDAWLTEGGSLKTLSSKLTEALLESPFLRSLRSQPEVVEAAAATASAASPISAPISSSESEPPSAASA